MTRAPLSLTVAKMRVRGKWDFTLIWKLDLVVQNNLEFLGVEVALGPWVSLVPASCTMSSGPGVEKSRHQPLRWPACQLIFRVSLQGSEVWPRADLKRPARGWGQENQSH